MHACRWAALAAAAMVVVAVAPGAYAARRVRGSSRVVRSTAVVSDTPLGETLYQRLQLLDVVGRRDMQEGYMKSLKCSNCLFEEDGTTPLSLRIMYMDVYPMTQNPKARAAAEKLGRRYSCDDPQLAVPECFVAENWNEGWIGELTSIFLKELGVRITALTRANFTGEVYEVYSGSSAYTRCVWEVRLGHIEMCIGDFWETEERRSISPYSTPIDSDILKLGTLPSGATQDIHMDSIFDPFTPELWGINVAMIFFSALCLWFVESTEHTIRLTAPRASSEAAPRARARIGAATHGVGQTVWLGAMGYVGGGIGPTARTWPGRMVLFGFGWFVYITSASYTANLVSFMMTSAEPTGVINAYGDIADLRGSLCILEAIDGMVVTPGIGKLSFDDYIPAIEALYQGRCLGVQVGRTEWKILVRGSQGEGTVCVDPDDTRGHSVCADPDGETKLVQLSGCTCKDKRTTDPANCPNDCPDHRKYCSLLEVQDEAFAYYMNYGLPVSKRIQDHASAWIIALKQEGVVQRLKNKYIDAVVPDVCHNTRVQAGSQPLPLSITGSVATYIVAVCFIAAGLIWYYFERRQQQDQAAAGELTVGAGERLAKEGIQSEVVQGKSLQPLPWKSPEDIWRQHHHLTDTQYDSLCTRLAQYHQAVQQQTRAVEQTQALLTTQIEHLSTLLARSNSSQMVPPHGRPGPTPPLQQW